MNALGMIYVLGGCALMLAWLVTCSVATHRRYQWFEDYLGEPKDYSFVLFGIYGVVLWPLVLLIAAMWVLTVGAHRGIGILVAPRRNAPASKSVDSYLTEAEAEIEAMLTASLAPTETAQ